MHAVVALRTAVTNVGGMILGGKATLLQDPVLGLFGKLMQMDASWVRVTVNILNHGEDHEHLSGVTVGDKDFGAIEHVVVTLQLCNRGALGGIGTSVRLGETESAQLAALGKHAQILLLLLLGAVLDDGSAAKAVMGGDNVAGGCAGLGNFLHGQSGGQVVRTRPAVFLRHTHAAHACIHGPVVEIDNLLATLFKVTLVIALLHLRHGHFNGNDLSQLEEGGLQNCVDSIAKAKLSGELGGIHNVELSVLIGKIALHLSRQMGIQLRGGPGAVEQVYAAVLEVGSGVVLMYIGGCMIIYGCCAGVSVAKLFLGGIIPGIIIGFGLMIIWATHCRKNPTVYVKHKKATWRERGRALRSAIWAILLPVIILGGVLTGVCTATECGVIAVAYALIIGGFVYRELKLKSLLPILVKTAKSTAAVMFVVGTATLAAYYITTAQIPDMLTKGLLAISTNKYVVILMINLLLLLVGCVMDLTPALLILAPILIPVIVELGLDPIWFGVVIVCNLCIGIITPPVGTVLYVGCGLSKLPMRDADAAGRALLANEQ